MSTRILLDPTGERAAATRERAARPASLEGKTIESIGLQAVGPGSFAVSVAADGVELSLRLDRQGARVASVGI